LKLFGGALSNRPFPFGIRNFSPLGQPYYKKAQRSFQPVDFSPLGISFLGWEKFLPSATKVWKKTKSMAKSQKSVCQVFRSSFYRRNGYPLFSLSKSPKQQPVHI